jgi:hypothetical protein
MKPPESTGGVLKDRLLLFQYGRAHVALFKSKISTVDISDENRASRLALSRFIQFNIRNSANRISKSWSNRPNGVVRT